MTEDEIIEVLAAHYPTQGVMCSPGHWAYGKGWFAHCGTGYDDQKGCDWSSEPHTFPDRETAQHAARAHLAHELAQSGL